MRYADFRQGTQIHPDILWIAVNIILHPEQRVLYTPLVLSLADGAIEILRDRLLLSEKINEKVVIAGNSTSDTH